MKLKYALLLFFYTLLSGVAAQAERFGYHQFADNNGDTLLYRMLVSDYDTVSSYPLVLFLHGRGERGRDNEAQLKWGVTNFATDRMMATHPAIVVAPQCPSDDYWAPLPRKGQSPAMTFSPTPTKSMALVLSLLDHLLLEWPIDKSRVYITGLSMGAFGTYDAMMRNPQLFAAAVPVCGGGDHSKAAIIADIPMWIYHGALDATISPFFSIEMVKALQQAGAHPGFTLYPHVGHFAWSGAYSDPLMLEWLFQQKK